MSSIYPCVRRRVWHRSERRSCWFLERACARARARGRPICGGDRLCVLYSGLGRPEPMYAVLPSIQWFYGPVAVSHRSIYVIAHMICTHARGKPHNNCRSSLRRHKASLSQEGSSKLSVDTHDRRGWLVVRPLGKISSGVFSCADITPLVK